MGGGKAALKRLTTSQIMEFDTEYVDDIWWGIVSKHIKEHFPDGDFTFADLGGGNGRFFDRVLREFPKSSGMLIDNSRYLISINKHNSRKKLICDSVQNSPKHLKDVDIVFCNWLLHHLVSSSYAETRHNINKTLAMARGMLSERGYVSIFENMYDGFYFDCLPSHIIFYLTSSKLFAPLMHKLGANTAGCGVCFLSKKQWVKALSEVGIEVLDYSDGSPWKFSFYKRVLLHLGDVRTGYMWGR